jgi:hypothetical protein
MPQAEVKHMLGCLYGGAQGLAEVRKIDAKITPSPDNRASTWLRRN